jgi:hypothetical protein
MINHRSVLRALLGITLTLACAVSAPAQTSPGTAWDWPAIPACLADPGTSTPGKIDAQAPICALYDELLQDGGATDLELTSARRMNAQLDGVLYPAFLPGTEVVGFVVASGLTDELRGTRQLVRVSASRAGARLGSWWTTLDQVTVDGHLMDANAIRSVLALTYAPACIATEDSVRPGVRAYLGVVAPAFDERGGGVEWWFPPDTVVATTVRPVPSGPGCP